MFHWSFLGVNSLQILLSTVLLQVSRITMLICLYTRDWSIWTWERFHQVDGTILHGRLLNVRQVVIVLLMIAGLLHWTIFLHGNSMCRYTVEMKNFWWVLDQIGHGVRFRRIFFKSWRSCYWGRTVCHVLQKSRKEIVWVNNSSSSQSGSRKYGSSISRHHSSCYTDTQCYSSWSHGEMDQKYCTHVINAIGGYTGISSSTITQRLDLCVSDDRLLASELISANHRPDVMTTLYRQYSGRLDGEKLFEYFLRDFDTNFFKYSLLFHFRNFSCFF